MTVGDQTKVVLTALFIAIFGIMALLFRGKPVEITAMDVALLALATFRLARMTAFDKVMQPFRAPVAAVKKDESGAGETTVPKGRGVRRSIGELITCPICNGTWIAAGLVYFRYLVPDTAQLFMLIMAVVGLVELLHDLTESLSWTGQAARQEAGEKEKD